jgi:hypothetical protein
MVGGVDSVIDGARKVIENARPLREFVYLDEVSLTSLLVSQRDTIPEHVTSGRSVSEQAEISAKASVDAVAAKAESATRYQTANSSSVESSRKAVVQTLFNKLRDDANLPITLRDDATGPVVIPSDGASQDEGLRGWRGADLLQHPLPRLSVPGGRGTSPGTSCRRARERRAGRATGACCRRGCAACPGRAAWASSELPPTPSYAGQVGVASGSRESASCITLVYHRLENDTRATRQESE